MLSPTMDKGNLVEWKAKVGDHLLEGDILANIETDKAIVPYETVDEGYLAKILIKGSTNDIDLGTPIGIFVPEKEDIAAFKDYVPEKKVKITSESLGGIEDLFGDIKPEEKSPKVEIVEEKPTKPSTGRVFISPKAKKLAEKNAVDVTKLKGTGPGGRIIFQDVLKAPKEMEEKVV